MSESGNSSARAPLATEPTIAMGQTPESTAGASPSLGATAKSSESASTAKKKTFRKPAPKPKERIYPVYPRPSNLGVLPSAMKTHPKGFKLLSSGSPIDRGMTTYFRLPPQPPVRVAAEKTKLAKMITKELGPSGTAPQGVVLDGFMMLDATGVKDPEEATECVINDSNVVGVVGEDLSYFTNLAFLDVGENNLQLADLAVLGNLEELHLHCNCVNSLALPVMEDTTAPDGSPVEGAESGVFPRLHTLNLSFNQISPTDLVSLGVLPSLQRLDLSCNGLKRLPRDMSFLSTVRQLALENNKLNNPEAILALAHMPNLAEVNLNYNQLASVPRLPDDGFQQLEVIGLASNTIVYFEDLYALTQLTTLKRIVLWGNPIEKRQKDSEILFYEFGNLNVELVMEPPVPPKRKTGQFYAAGCQSFVQVKDFKKVMLRGDLNKRQNAPKSAPPTTGLPPEPLQQPDGGPSFFVTQTDPIGGPSVSAGASRQPSDMPQQEQTGFSPPSGDPGHNSWLGRWDAGASYATTGMKPTVDDPSILSGSQQRQQGRQLGRQSPMVGTELPSIHNRPYSSSSYGQLSGSALDDITEDEIRAPRANVRTVMTELKRMLRQPLPPLHSPHYAGAKAKSGPTTRQR